MIYGERVWLNKLVFLTLFWIYRLNYIFSIHLFHSKQKDNKNNSTPWAEWPLSKFKFSTNDLLKIYCRCTEAQKMQYLTRHPSTVEV